MAAQLIFQQAPETWDYFNPLSLRYAVELLKRDGGFITEYRPGGAYPDPEDPIWTMGGSDGFGNVWPRWPSRMQPSGGSACGWLVSLGDPPGVHHRRMPT
jgi:hypothetical protein